MSAKPDATINYAKRDLASFLNLPAGWQISGLRLIEDHFLQVEVVFPDGPTEHEPILLKPTYHRLIVDGKETWVPKHIDVYAEPEPPSPRGSLPMFRRTPGAR